MFAAHAPTDHNPTTQDHSTSRESRPSAPKTQARRIDDMVLGFEPGRRKLPGSELLVLERWVNGLMAWRPQSIIIMAHDISAPNATRMARLRDLRDLVERLGVPRESIKYTDLALSALPVVSGDAHSSDAVVLRAIDPPSEAQPVRSVASCFGALALSS